MRTSERHRGCVSGLASVTALVSEDAVQGFTGIPASLAANGPLLTLPPLPSSLIKQTGSTGPDISMKHWGTPETPTQCPLTIGVKWDKDLGGTSQQEASSVLQFQL